MLDVGESSFLLGQFQSVVIGEERSHPLLSRVPNGLVLSPLLFNLYMRLLGKLICHLGVKYHQCANHTQLYICAPGKLSDAVEVLSWCLEAVRVWMWSNRLQLNMNKIELLWIWVPVSSRTMPSVVLYGVVLPQVDRCATWGGVFLDSQFLLREQVSIIARRPFVQLYIEHQLCLFLDWGGGNSTHGHSCPSHLPVQLL